MQHTELGQKSLKLLGMHFWQVDALSLPFMKQVMGQHWQLSPNAILLAFIVFFRETSACEGDLMKAEKAYISAWYGQTKETSLAEARYLLRIHS